MKILNIPKIMDDELFFSYVLRTASANAYIRSQFMRDFVDESKKHYFRLSYGMNNRILKFAESIGANPAELFLKTTLYPLISMMVSKQKQIHIINYVLRDSHKYASIITPIQSEIKELYICPCCVEEERNAYGFSWYHRAHNFPGIIACHKHRVPLKKYTGSCKDVMNMDMNCFETISCKNVEIEADIAAFCYSLLYSGFDYDCSIITKEIIRRLNKEGLYKHFQIMMPDVFDRLYSKRDLENRLRSKGHIDCNFLLRCMYITFKKCKNIRLSKDTTEIKYLLMNSDGYDVFQPLRTNIVLMKKPNEQCFVTTPYGFRIGWRSPYSDDVLDEQEKFVELMNRVKNKEYELISQYSSMNKKIELVHKKCGCVYKVNPKRFLEEGSDCPCLHRVNISLMNCDSDLIKQNISVAATNKKGIISVTCGNCNSTFNIGYRAWKIRQYCRNCINQDPRKYYESQQSILIYGTTSPSNETVKTGLIVYGPNVFEHQVYQLAGHEYKLVEPFFRNNTDEIEILHTVCGRIKKYTAARFLNGERCPCRLKLVGEEFVGFVSKYSEEVYSVTKINNQRYIIENNLTHEKKIMSKRRILQELLRPSHSELLPLEKKNTAVSPFKESNRSIVRRALKSHFQIGDEFTNRTTIPGISQEQLRKYLHGPGLPVVVQRLGKGRYRYIGENNEQ